MLKINIKGNVKSKNFIWKDDRIKTFADVRGEDLWPSDLATNLRIAHSKLDTKEISEVLQLEASDSWRAGELNGRGEESTFGCWKYSVSGSGLDDQFRIMLKHLHGKRDALKKMRQRDYNVSFVTFWESLSWLTTDDIGVESIRELGVLEIPIILDVYF